MEDMSTVNPLIEPSFTSTLRAIEAAKDLPKDKRKHWACSLRVIAKGLDKPPELIPARWTAVRIPISRLHHAQLGVTAKTLANHKANARAALGWFAEEENVPSRGALLTRDWARLRLGISHYRTRANLSSLMRYSSARAVPPEEVTELILDEFMRYRATTTALASNAAARRRIARAWNGCIGVVPGWPSQKLLEPPLTASLRASPWEEFPARLREDIDTYLAGLARLHRDARGRRRAPCKPSTIKLCRAKLVAFVRKAVGTGVPLDNIASFRELCDPELVERVFDAYWRDRGEEPSVYLIDLASLLMAIARQTRCIDGAAIARLDDMRVELEKHRRVGLTDKNMALVRQVLSSEAWRLVVNLPWQLMQEANAIRDSSPVKAAGLAQLAVAIAILCVFPVRLGNLGAIRIGENLIRPGGQGTPYWLVFSGYDVKNRVRLETIFGDELTELIDDYIHNHLHVLLRGSNEPYLFPGMHGGHKGLATLSSQITKRIQRATGLRITVHQFQARSGSSDPEGQPATTNTFAGS